MSGYLLILSCKYNMTYLSEKLLNIYDYDTTCKAQSLVWAWQNKMDSVVKRLTNVYDNNNDIYYLKFIPNELKTYELCKLCIQQNWCALAYTPEEFITYDLCKVSVLQNEYALILVPKKFLTYELCQLAMQKNKRILEFIPDKLKILIDNKI